MQGSARKGEVKTEPGKVLAGQGKTTKDKVKANPMRRKTKGMGSTSQRQGGSQDEIKVDVKFN